MISADFDLIQASSCRGKRGHPACLDAYPGTPETMQKDIQYDSLFSDILQSLRKSIRRAESSGVDPQQIVIDPGLASGNLEGNLLLIRTFLNSESLENHSPGTSRKSFLGKFFKQRPDSVWKDAFKRCHRRHEGAHIIRCHDVLQAKKAILVADAVRLAGERLEAKGERPGVQSSG